MTVGFEMECAVAEEHILNLLGGGGAEVFNPHKMVHLLNVEERLGADHSFVLLDVTPTVLWRPGPAHEKMTIDHIADLTRKGDQDLVAEVSTGCLCVGLQRLRSIGLDLVPASPGSIQFFLLPFNV